LALRIKDGLKADKYEIPEMALDELDRIEVRGSGDWERAPWQSDPPAGDYAATVLVGGMGLDGKKKHTVESHVRLNRDFAHTLVGESVRQGIARNASTFVHEIGHHVHLSKLSLKAFEEWRSLSDRGRNAKITSYATTNEAEHFAEAFSAYCCAGVGHRNENRQLLSLLEPKVSGFMERLMRTPEMWVQKGKKVRNG
jgi:hypothetical protein